MRAVARRWRVSPATVLLWVRRAGRRRLDRCDWEDRRSGPDRPWNRTARRVESRIMSMRRALADHSVLGECGAQAIHAEMQRLGLPHIPSLRTIGRVLARRGALDGRLRLRHPAPPRGWYLPQVLARRAELDSFDIIEDLKLKGGPLISVLTGIALHGGQADAWPRATLNAKGVLGLLWQRWRDLGCPRYAQFDNDTLFQGAHQFADSVGRVSRLCLALGVTPVFAPPQEPGFQNLIEHFNGLWQSKLWGRFHFASLAELKRQSARYIRAHRRKARARGDAAPRRRPLPKDFTLDLNAPLRGRIIFLRRADGRGCINVLGHRLRVGPAWTHRLVRCEVDFTRERITGYGLRRRDPRDQPKLFSIPYHRPNRPFLGAR